MDGKEGEYKIVPLQVQTLRGTEIRSIFYLSTKWRWEIRFMLWLSYPWYPSNSKLVCLSAGLGSL